MFISIRRHPLKITHAKALRLVSSVNNLLRSRCQFSPSITVANRFKRIASRKSDLHKVVRTEAGWWATCGTTSRQGVWRIKFSFGRFQAALKELEQMLPSTDGRSARNLLQDVDRAAEALEVAIFRLGKSVDSCSVKVVELHGAGLEAYIKVRDAMCALDKVAAENLTGPEVDCWSTWPVEDIENPAQALRIAKLILVSKVPDQVFGLSVQSGAPGRPLKLMTRFNRFPTEADLRALGRRMGGPVKIYVTVSKPRWRKVWTFDPDNVVWLE